MRRCVDRHMHGPRYIRYIKVRNLKPRIKKVSKKRMEHRERCVHTIARKRKRTIAMSFDLDQMSHQAM